MMVLKYINPDFKLRREHEYDIWQEAVNGSVWLWLEVWTLLMHLLSVVQRLVL